MTDDFKVFEDGSSLRNMFFGAAHPEAPSHKPPAAGAIIAAPLPGPKR